MNTTTARKTTKMEFCERHAPWFAPEARRRKIECMIEGGPGGWSPGCRNGRCRLWPGTDTFDPAVCTAELELEWTTAPPAYPNHDPKPRGTFVVNVHPCGRYDDAGVVLSEEADAIGGSLSVRTGRGSTCYGPAINWRPTDRRPAWLARLELEATA